MQTTSQTISNNQYHNDDIINDFMEHVRHCPLDSDAINNIPVILKRYDRRKSFKDKIKLLLNK